MAPVKHHHPVSLEIVRGNNLVACRVAPNDPAKVLHHVANAIRVDYLASSIGGPNQ